MRYLFILLFLSPSIYAAALFTQNCRAIGNDYLQFSIESDFKKNSAFPFKITAFEDENCKIPYLQFNQYFTIDDFQSEQINLRTKKITYTALSEEVSRALNIINYCDISEWQLNVETNVTGKMCDDYQQLSRDDLFYQIIKITQSSLQFGSTTENLDGRSPNKRPDQFDTLEYSAK